MLLRHTKRLACVLAALLPGTTGFAQECDPAKHLVKDTVANIRDVRTKIAYNNATTEKKDTNQTQDTGVKLFSDLGVSNKDASKMSSLLTHLLKIDISQSDQHWLLVSALSPESAGSYAKCLEHLKKAIVVTLDPNAPSSKSFVVNVSHVLYQPAPKQMVPIKIIVTNGGVENNGAIVSNYVGEIEGAGKEIFRVVRDDMYAPMSIAIRIGSDLLSPQVTLPALPAFRIERFEIKSDPFEGRLADTHALWGPREICASIPEDVQDAVVIPDTVHVDYAKKIVSLGGVIESDWREIANRKGCVTIKSGLGSLKGVTDFKGHVRAFALKAVPVSQASRTPPDVKN